MNIEFLLHSLSALLKEDLEEYSLKRFEHLDKFLKTFPFDGKILTIAIDHEIHHNRFEVKCTLQLNGKVFHHVELSHNPQEALDICERNLIQQAKKHVEMLRKPRRERRLKKA